MMHVKLTTAGIITSTRCSNVNNSGGDAANCDGSSSGYDTSR